MDHLPQEVRMKFEKSMYYTYDEKLEQLEDVSNIDEISQITSEHSIIVYPSYTMSKKYMYMHNNRWKHFGNILKKDKDDKNLNLFIKALY
jgi:hypothetical protein